MREVLQEDTPATASGKEDLVWMAVKWITMYSVWTHRNTMIFSGANSNLVENLFEIQRSSFEWMSRKDKKWSKSWEEWLENPASNNG